MQIARIYADGHWDTSITFSGIFFYPMMFTNVVSLNGQTDFWVAGSPFVANVVTTPTTTPRTSQVYGALYYVSSGSTTPTLIFAPTAYPMNHIAYVPQLSALLGVNFLESTAPSDPSLFVQWAAPLPTSALAPTYPFSAINSYYYMYRVCGFAFKTVGSSFVAYGIECGFNSGGSEYNNGVAIWYWGVWPQPAGATQTACYQPPSGLDGFTSVIGQYQQTVVNGQLVSHYFLYLLAQGNTAYTTTTGTIYTLDTDVIPQTGCVNVIPTYFTVYSASPVNMLYKVTMFVL